MIRMKSALAQVGCAMSACVMWACCIAAIFVASNTCAFAKPATNPETIVVRDDRGGPLIERAKIVDTYRLHGTRVQLRGRFCLSACTLYLGLDNTCISSTTVFGFHGPSSPMYGIALPQRVFDYWSSFMAEHYPEPLKSWFLEAGRHRIVGFHSISGARLIEMGIAECPRNPQFRTGWLRRADPDQVRWQFLYGSLLQYSEAIYAEVDQTSMRQGFQ